MEAVREMRLHTPSFLHFLQFAVPFDVPFMSHRNTVYLFSAVPLRDEFLTNLITQTVTRSMLEPVGALRSTEERSLFSLPPEPHIEALCRALVEDRGYIRKTRSERGGTGERVSQYEYQIDLAHVNKIVQAVRVEEDAKLIRSLIQGDVFTSIRIARKKIFLSVGRDFSKVRLEKALKHLEQQGVLARPKGKSRLHTVGREVVSA